MRNLDKVIIDENNCKGCGICEYICPEDVIMLSESKINRKGYHPAQVVNEVNCIGCTSCAIMCPDIAIKIER